MSSTNRGAVRVANDAYYTKDVVARACVARLGNSLPMRSLAGFRCWDPHAGGGAFVRALAAVGAEVVASDVTMWPDDWKGARWMAGVDFLHTTPTFCPAPGADFIVGNPPFDDAERHIRHAIGTAKVGVAFLLRLAFLEGGNRAPFWADHPPTRVSVFVARPGFDERYEDGTIGPLRKRNKDTHELVLNAKGKPVLAGVDSAAYGLFEWWKDRPRMPIEWLKW